jgi:GAF domain-containing protein
MPDWLRQVITPPVFPDDEDKTRVAAQLNLILWTFAAVVVLVGIAVPFLFAGQGLAIVAVLAILIVLTSGMLLLMHRGQVQLAGAIFSLGMWGLYALLIVGTGGMTSPVNLTWIVVVIIAGLLLGRRAALGFAGLSSAAGLVVLYAERNGFLPPRFITFSSIGGWTLMAAHLGIAGMLLYVATSGVDDALGRARSTAAELEEQRDRLETLVEERTHDLARHSNYLEATAQVAREIAATLELGILLPRVVDLVSQQFSFYHTALFLIDASGEWAELKAASSEGGKRMLKREQRLPVGSQGIVGFAALQGQARIALDTSRDAAFAYNPDLPDTRSEISLPLQVGGQVIGVLDVQSTEPSAFDDEDVAVLQTLADQIALAINNARLYAQIQESLEAQRRVYGELSHQAWTQLLRTRTDLGFARDIKGLSPASGSWQPHMKAAVQEGKASLMDGEATTIALPIQVRDQVIGVINVERPNETGAWTPEQIEMLQTLSQQLGLALDSARLYQDTQRRAARERTIQEISDRMQRSADMATLMQIAADELNRSLGGSRAYVRLGTETQLLGGDGRWAGEQEDRTEGKPHE